MSCCTIELDDETRIRAMFQLKLLCEWLAQRKVYVCDYGITEEGAYIKVKCNDNIITVNSAPLRGKGYLFDDLNNFQNAVLSNSGKYVTKEGSIVVVLRTLGKKGYTEIVAFLPEVPCSYGNIVYYTNTGGHGEMGLDIYKMSSEIKAADENERRVTELKEKLENLIYPEYSIKYCKRMNYDLLDKSWKEYNNNWNMYQIKKVAKD